MNKIMLHSVVSFLLVFLFFATISTAVADEIRVAVASNFNDTLQKITDQFEIQSGHKVTVISGSTGKHYAQIKNAAPFEILFAADTKRPLLLEQESIALPNSRFTYAIGKLVLWSPDKEIVDSEGRVLLNGNFRHLAMANPRHAPYGLAARQVLEKLGLLSTLQGRLVRGENIGQTFQFVKSGNVPLGFVALSQLRKHDNTESGSYWDIPQQLYRPIEQQAVLLKDNQTAHEFLAFVKTDIARKIIKKSGYEIP